MEVARPATVEGVLEALADDPDALVLAGGTVMVEVNAGHRHPGGVVSGTGSRCRRMLAPLPAHR